MSICQGERNNCRIFGKLRAIETSWLIFNQNIKQELCNKHVSQHNRPAAVVGLGDSMCVSVWRLNLFSTGIQLIVYQIRSKEMSFI